MSRRLPMVVVLLAALAVPAGAVEDSPKSETVAAVLRNPLPAEDLAHSVDAERITIRGPTFTYAVDRATGVIRALQVRRAGHLVVQLDDAADLVIGDYRLASNQNTGTTAVARHSCDQLVLKTEGVLKSPTHHAAPLPYRLSTVFYNDGVVVSEMTLLPKQTMRLGKGIEFRLKATGQLTHYLHKESNRHGHTSPHGPLPAAAGSVCFTTPTSCLQVFSPTAALAAFTDRGAIPGTGAARETAVIHVRDRAPGQTAVTLTQCIAGSGPDEPPCRLAANTEWTFRVGMSLAPNRRPHRRQHDLRMFIWIGDERHPYPSDREIEEVAQLGYTLFQMHRLGTPGAPRAPAGQLDRVIRSVHAAGMLFLWTTNADLMYANATGVVELRASGRWALWQGFNYGGRYRAAMDSSCDLLATCLAAPNGLADYRLECIERMMDRYDVDGMYVDDNLAYANCTLAAAHDHPRSPYDSLIELHAMNWRRRQLLRRRCPHAVLVDHCSTGLVLPVICDFDVHLYGEGYGFGSLEEYWSLFGAVGSMHAQGNIWAGDSEDSRCPARAALSYDLLTGGGQYTYLDWRLYPAKFPYARGVTRDELAFVRTYNLPQYYFGMYESTPYYFATSADIFSTTTPGTYATIYHNHTWHDYLIAIANMTDGNKETALAIHSLDALQLAPATACVLYDVHEQTVQATRGGTLAMALARMQVPAQGLRLLYLRAIPDDVPYHLWGGKRIAETWDPAARTLTLHLHGPKGLRDTVVIRTAPHGVGMVQVDGQRADFACDPARQTAEGRVTFDVNPVKVTVVCPADRRARLADCGGGR